VATSKKLPSRPHLDHLRKQAKSLLAALKEGDPAAIAAFVEHLPEARRMGAAEVTAAGFRLADAQSVVARQTGFASWPGLSRHVQELRGLEGDWRFESLEIDGMTVPAAALGASRILMDGDRFRTESPEATYEGQFSIDADESPAHITIEFISGPEAGNTSKGIYELAGDTLRLCLCVQGDERPAAFATKPGSGHAYERLRRVSAARPENVTGGTPPPPAPEVVAPRGDRAAFDVPPSEALRRLGGDWAAVALVMDGTAMPDTWLAMGSRTMHGNELKVVFGGQTMVHAKVRIDESVSPIAVDYYNLGGKAEGTVTFGIMAWDGDEAEFLMAPPGAPRPTSLADRKGTLSRWRRRA